MNPSTRFSRGFAAGFYEVSFQDMESAFVVCVPTGGFIAARGETPGKSHKNQQPQRGCVGARGICGHGHNIFGVGMKGFPRSGVGFTALRQLRAKIRNSVGVKGFCSPLSVPDGDALSGEGEFTGGDPDGRLQVFAAAFHAEEDHFHIFSDHAFIDGEVVGIACFR